MVSLKSLSAGKESLSRASEPGQRAGGTSDPARDCLASVARVKLYLYDKVVDFQTWKVLSQTASSPMRPALADRAMHLEQSPDLSPEALGSSWL